MLNSAFPSLLTSRAHRPPVFPLFSGFFHNQVQFHFPPLLPSSPSGSPTSGYPYHARVSPSLYLTQTLHLHGGGRGGAPGRMWSAHESPSGPKVSLNQHCPRTQGARDLEPGKGQGGRDRKTKRACLQPGVPTVGFPHFRSAHFCPLLNHQKLAKRVVLGEKDKEVLCLSIKKTKL